MGEAKRRKLLDPNYGKPKIYSIQLDKRDLTIKDLIFEGFITLKDESNYVL